MTVFDQFSSHQFQIHFSSQEHYDEIMQLLEKNGFIWQSDDLPTQWGTFNYVNYLQCNGNRLSCGSNNNPTRIMRSGEFLRQAKGLDETESKKRFLARELVLSPRTEHERESLFQIFDNWELKTHTGQSVRELYQSIPLSALDFRVSEDGNVLNPYVRSNYSVAQFIKENLKDEKMGFQLVGNKNLINAAIKELVDAGYREGGRAENEIYVNVTDTSKLIVYTSEDLGVDKFSLPKDWEEFEKRAGLKGSVKTVVINGLTLTNQGVAKDAVFRIQEHEMQVTQAWLDDLEKIFEFTEKKDGLWGFRAERIQIGCTPGFTREHLQQMKAFVTSLKK